MSAMDIDGASNSGKEHAQQEAAAQPSPGPMTPAFLLQLIKLLRRKENLLGKAKLHNDSLEALRKPPEDSKDAHAEPAPVQVAAIQREYAWCVVQVDRANFQLRNALWGVALGLYRCGTGDGDGDAGDSARRPLAPPHWDMGWGAVASSGPHAGAGVPPGDTLKQCVHGAHALIRAVASGPSLRRDGSVQRRGYEEGGSASAGGAEDGAKDPVHGLVGRSLSLLLLLRSFEERTATLASAGRALEEAERLEWDAAFSSAMASLKSDQGAQGGGALQTVHREIAANLAQVRQSIAPA